jgi:hypothetical protein
LEIELMPRNVTPLSLAFNRKYLPDNVSALPWQNRNGMLIGAPQMRRAQMKKIRPQGPGLNLTVRALSGCVCDKWHMRTGDTPPVGCSNPNLTLAA